MDLRLKHELDRLSSHYEELTVRLSRPESLSDHAKYSDMMREHSRLTPIVKGYLDYLGAERQHKQALFLLEDPDPEIHYLARQECIRCEAVMESNLQQLRSLLQPHDPDDDKCVIIEIRAAAGGEEAALFASDLYRMYHMYAASQGLSTMLMSQNATELGGYRTVSFSVEGQGAYSRFRYESGVHRVQRIPRTESQGKIQTSTVTVAVLPQAEEVEVRIDPSEIIFESMKSSGAGGQHINKTESAVRLTHKPSGIVIECDTERSQFKNKDTALKMLRAQLYDISRRKQQEEMTSRRREQVGSGDRSERIRTYNYPQSRVTDHRIGFVSHGLDSLLGGDMDTLIRALRDADIASRERNEE